jgi:AhpD family alkylhydroperoxidase
MATPAPDYAEQMEDTAEQMYGFVPNLITEIVAENPAVAEIYLNASALMRDEGVLSDPEREAVFLAVSSHNDCHYCKAAHAGGARQAGLPTDTVETLNEGGLPDDDRLKSLVRAARRILNKRGWLSDVDEAEFSDLGLDRPELYEIVALVGIKTLSTYVNHIAGTTIDDALT